MTEKSTLINALYTIKKLKQLLAETKEKSSQPIAIVGMACRYPEASNKQEYWNLLCLGKNIISSFPEERWELLKNTRETLLQNEARECKGGFLKHIADFDAYFFGITPREAKRMDPQQRLMLEVAYEAFEDAGVSTEMLAGSDTGVFTSMYSSQLTHLQSLEDELDALYIPTGNAVSMAANRLSYLFDLRGPSIIFDTACSSSLVALNLACLHLQTKLCKMALVCAANLNLLPSLNLLLSKAKMLSPDGQCKTFDAAANGYVQGEGVGVVVLKPLSQALLDKDRIYAVIMGSAVNQDGKTNGLTAPNGLQQEKLLHAAYQHAKVSPSDVSYVECHGTGTFLGDPIEVEALGNVLGKGRAAYKPCWIGSVKTNIGHLEPAAGMASLIKVALALHHAKIPAHLNVTTPNPHISFDQYHFRIPVQTETWPDGGSYRLAGISGFGFGGTNAHAVVRSLTVEETLATTDTANTESTTELFTLSAKDPAALKELIERWCQFLETSQHSLATICYNLHVRRSHYPCRVAVICDSTEMLLQSLRKLKDKNLDECAYENHELSSLAKSYVNKEKIDWVAYEKSRSFPVIDMPLYPWQRKTYWPELIRHQEIVHSFDYPFQRRKIESPLASSQFEFRFDIAIMPEIKDTFNFLHAGYYLEMVAFVVDALYQKNSFVVENLIFFNPIFVANNSVMNVHLILETNQDNNVLLTFYSRSQNEGQHWTKNAAGVLMLDLRQSTPALNTTELKNRCPLGGSAEIFKSRVKAMGMPAEGSIAWTSQYWLNDNEILCEFREPLSLQQQHVHEKFNLNIHPGIIDGCVQSLFMLLPTDFIKPFVAASIGKLTWYGSQNQPAFLASRMTKFPSGKENYVSDFSLLDSAGNVIANCEQLSMALLDGTVQLNREVRVNLPDMHSPSLTDHERKRLAIDYLIEQVSIIFSIPEQDIDVNVSLREMGIDSLMAIVLSTNIETGLGMTYPMQSLLTGPTINDIAECVQHGRTSTVMNTRLDRDANPWIAYRVNRTKPRLRLFCFPYGGGGASIYSAWHKDLPDSVEVCPIQLPGRENRMGESPLDNLSSLINVLIENLQPELDIPFAFFGHSFGSLVAFELARALRKRGMPQPVHIFASAFPDPRIPTRSLNNLMSELRESVNINLFELMHESSVSSLNDSELQQLADIFRANGLVDFGNHMLNKDIMKMLLPIFIGDMNLVKSYQYVNEKPLDCPITVFLGKQDGWVTYEDHLGWSEHSANQCKFHEFDSGHLFIKEESIRKEMLGTILLNVS